MNVTQSIDLDDVTLSCLVVGDGPLVLCAHGFPDDARTFRHQVKPLVERGPFEQRDIIHPIRGVNHGRTISSVVWREIPFLARQRLAEPVSSPSA